MHHHHRLLRRRRRGHPGTDAIVQRAFPNSRTRDAFADNAYLLIAERDARRYYYHNNVRRR